MTEKYEERFVDMFKEAEFLSSSEAEKIGIEAWRVRCQKLYDKAKQAKDDIDKEIQKLSEIKKVFWRIDLNYARCDMLHYYLKEDCESKPEKCPTGVKELIIKELEEDLSDAKRMLEWGVRKESDVTKGMYSKHYNEQIQKINDKINKLRA